jgi:broad specificity polyphosphatase/5'/3'-nucleotidase SurE
MKTTYTIAAIAMFAVMLGMSALAPAMAYHEENPKHKATASQCHYDVVEDIDETLLVDESLESAWIVLHTSSQGSTNGHQKHLDKLVTNDVEALACVTNQDGSVIPIEV